MSLTGPVLLAVLALATVGLVVLAVTVPRPGPRGGEDPGGTARVRRLAARTALVVAAQGAAVLLVGAAVNDWGYFYGSWSDLLGTSASAAAAAPVAVGGPRPPTAAGTAGRDLAGPAADAVATGRWGRLTAVRDAGWSTSATEGTLGRLDAVTVTGARSGLVAHGYVWLPPQYLAAGAAARTFPAVEVLTGYPGRVQNLVRRLRDPQHLLAETTAGRAKPMVLVMLSPTVAPPRDTECTDIPAGPQAETFLAQDVPLAVGHAYRVTPGDWGVMGDSTGGYCAAKVVLDHSDAFPAGVALSGYFHTLSDSTTGSLWGGSPVLRDLNDLEWRLAHQPQPPASLLLTSSKGEQGANGWTDTLRFARLAHAPLRVDTLVLPSGGHNFGTWGVELPKAFDWLSARLAEAAPGRTALRSTA